MSIFVPIAISYGPVDCGVFVCSVGNIDGAYRTTLFLGLKALGHCVNCPEIKDAMLGYKNGELITTH
jgi:hypothetical protein